MKKYVVMLGLAVFTVLSMVSNSYAYKKGDAWIYLCNNTHKPASKRKCVLLHEQVSQVTGRIGLRILVRRHKKNKRLILVGLDRRFNSSKGVWLRVDKNKPFRVPFKRCGKVLCTSGGYITAKLQRQLVRGRKLLIASYDKFGALKGFKASLRGYASASRGKPVNIYAYMRVRNRVVKRVKRDYHEQMFEKMFGF